jgi:hypothetical protein
MGALILKYLGKSGLDTLTLKLDLPERPAGYSGSLADRANALARYALEYDGVTVSSGNSLCREIVNRAAKAINGKSALPNVTLEEFAEFKLCAEKDGFVFDNEDGAAEIPASDRVVHLDHNSSIYKETLAKVDEVETEVIRVNDYPDPEERGKHVAELSAGKRLLQATHVNVAAVTAVLMPVLVYLARKFADNAIGILAGATIAILIKLLGLS